MMKKGTTEVAMKLSWYLGIHWESTTAYNLVLESYQSINVYMERRRFESSQMTLYENMN